MMNRPEVRNLLAKADVYEMKKDKGLATELLLQ